MQESSLYYLLLNNLSWGFLSANQCREIAQAAVADIDQVTGEGPFPKLRSLATARSGNSSNSWRRASRLLDEESALTRPYKVKIPYKGGEKCTSVMLPHEMLASLWDNQDMWKSTVIADESELPRFWQALRGHPALVGHPMLARPDFATRCIPLACHGDEVPVTGVGKVWARSALVMSWMSLLANASGGCTMSVMLYIWGVFEKFVVGDRPGAPGTMKVFWRIMRWSFEAVFAGRWPARDWRGVELLS